MDLATLILAKQHIMHCCRKMSQKTFPRFLLGFSLLSAPLAFKFLDPGLLILDGCAVGMDWLVGRLDCRRRRRRRSRRRRRDFARDFGRQTPRGLHQMANTNCQEQMVEAQTTTNKDDNECGCARLLLVTLKLKMGSQNVPAP